MKVFFRSKKIEGRGSKEGVSGGCGSDCRAESEPHGTAYLLRCTLSAVMKSLRNDCCTKIYGAAF
jgi:hypothetical protein